MSQVYSLPENERSRWSLPDVETFYLSAADIRGDNWVNDDGQPYDPGWYYWFCLPGCMPDSSAFGPFATEALAIESAQSQND